MTKQDEMRNRESCWNKAKDNEVIFVLRGQDYSSPKAIMFWIMENLTTTPEAKLRDAFNAAMAMKAQSRKAPD